MGVIDDIKAKMKTNEVTEIFSELMVASVFIVGEVVKNRIRYNGGILSQQDEGDIDRYIRSNFSAVSKKIQEELFHKYTGK